jgi:hypothetical protein
MKLWANSFVTSCILAAVGVVSSVPGAYAASYTLSDGNSSLSVDTSSQTGLNGWTVDGQNQLNQQWFWYRVGSSGPEASIDSLALQSSVQTAANALTTTYANSQFSITVKYTLLGGDPGSGTANIAEQFAINNLTASSLAFNFFQYSDFAPGGSLNNTIQFGQDLQGHYNEAVANTASGSVSIDTGVASGANHFEASSFPTTLNKLNDGNTDDLNDTVDAGPGHIPWSLEWNRILAGVGLPNSSLTISDVISITTNPVPDFAGQWPLMLGLAGCLVVRRYVWPRIA